MKKKMPELLSPAGDLEKLETAVRFGADAVYVGAGPYSLRASQTAFMPKDLEKGISFAHKHKVKVYLAMNIFAFDDDFAGMKDYLKKAIKLGIDAVIVSDPGVIALVRQVSKKIKIHLSTQANTLNSEAVKFWKKQGVSRIVLARELFIDQIRDIRKAVPNIELELFIHGAMCMSYSGRCLLSKHLTGKSGNRGDCTHPCRWEYQFKETTRPSEEFTMEEDPRGTYIMNSKDLCCIEYIKDLIEAGVDSFKIEGRMKSVYYVALVTKIYREAIDTYINNPKKFKYNPSWKIGLEKVSHRHYTSGFYFGSDDKENNITSSYMRNYSFVGVVKSHKDDRLEILGRNYFAVGDELEIIDPNVSEVRKIKVTNMKTQDNKSVDKAHNGYHVFIDGIPPSHISSYSLLQRKI